MFRKAITFNSMLSDKASFLSLIVAYGNVTM